MFLSARALTATLSLRVGRHWDTLFQKTALIYGLEMLAVFAILFGPCADLAGKTLRFTWVTIMRPMPWLAKLHDPPIIAAMTQLIWFRISELNMSVWFERAPSKKNIAALPTKRIPMPFASFTTKTFRCAKRCFRIITQSGLNMKAGLPVDPPSNTFTVSQ